MIFSLLFSVFVFGPRVIRALRRNRRDTTVLFQNPFKPKTYGCCWLTAAAAADVDDDFAFCCGRILFIYFETPERETIHKARAIPKQTV